MLFHQYTHSALSAGASAGRYTGHVVALDAVKRNLDEIFAAQSIRDQQEAGYTQEHFVKVLRAHPELVASVIDVKSQKRLRKNLVL